ncbi:hypothetical protein PHYBLDRAFT_176033 [Phycomyces blakesleeanus NRRL 1555(-)]|uniref:Uncharacterized protein n=1 Tax=Phycomyces blakesleeanus (strain ATCC 8743b / DSM 1359 / FGSC 10004 / NBRC 33097 / NRRL 1555) TaxID=763407 RepID=A0A162W9L2_PHYB8|nr:hypothetical protein PHYBLDRAFT_176033 [Phycomyces blakesleeanus NRRL 1555(-)]OAD65645.1 hypothetical protein PHYBLDRAFT_176033 [Phycomyces blakesleeanus NRRL 1555(-)]|eukprot:XP_018283685.1 hypothetical protein PHYBLDRAFT_176033 [Phycomyces blakesleeanus NRRL 1555(-)]
MFSNSILDSYQCNFCKEHHPSLKKINNCRVQYFKNCCRRHNDIQTSQITYVPEQVSIVLNTVSNKSIIRENDTTNDDQTVNSFNNSDNNESMYSIEYDNTIEESVAMKDIEDVTTPMVYDFSQPLPTPSYNDAKNLKIIQIIKDFDISCKAHEKIISHFNKILATSTDITYRVCTPYLGKKLLKRFSRIEEKKYNVCCNSCMLFNDEHETKYSNCSKDCYKSTDDNNALVPARTMVQLPLVTVIRTLGSFCDFHEADESSQRELIGQSPLATLDAFSEPYFFALDEMHSICHGVAKQVWGLITGKYRKKHLLVLSVEVQKEIGAAMTLTRKTIPKSFYGAWRDVSKNTEYFKAVDWTHFLLELVEWNVYLETLLAKDKVDLNVFTINQNLLQHYPDMIEAFGLPRSYCAILVERAIDEYSNAIKREECSMIEAAIQTSHKVFDGCVIDSALNQNYVREAHNIRLQIQVDEKYNNGQMKPMVVHLADVKELVGLVKLGATINTITTTATTYVV